MILSTLSTRCRDFTFSFPKMPHMNEDVFLTYKPMIIPYPLPTILASNKVHHKSSPEAYGALEQPPLNQGSTPLESSNKVHLLLDT